MTEVLPLWGASWELCGLECREGVQENGSRLRADFQWLNPKPFSWGWAKLPALGLGRPMNRNPKHKSGWGLSCTNRANAHANSQSICPTPFSTGILIYALGFESQGNILRSYMDCRITVLWRTKYAYMRVRILPQHRFEIQSEATAHLGDCGARASIKDLDGEGKLWGVWNTSGSGFTEAQEPSPSSSPSLY